MADEIYLGNPNLKKANTTVEFDKDQILEFMRCKANPVYFAQRHVKIVTLDHGLTPYDCFQLSHSTVSLQPLPTPIVVNPAFVNCSVID